MNQVEEELSLKQCKYLLYNCNVLSPVTPHKINHVIKDKTEMICSQVQPIFADQKSYYKCSAICLNNCSVIEIDYDICR